MDLPIAAEAPDQATDANGRGKRKATPALPKRDDRAKAPHMTAAKRSRARRRSRRGRLTDHPTALLVGAAIVGLAVYGSTQMARQGPATVTRELPPASASAAAVMNLPPPDLLKPLSPEDAAKLNAERPFVDRPDTPASRFVLHTDAEDRERAVTCLTQAVYYEAAGEGDDGGRAVAQIVLNRLRHPGYPASVCGVVYQGADRLTGCQFTFTCDGSLLRQPAEALWARSRKIAEDALNGRVYAQVGHATHYHADYVLPYWADSLDKTVQIARHIFYRLRGTVGDRQSFFQRYVGVEPAIPEPRPAMVVPGTVVPTEEEQQLAKALVGEDSKGTAQDAEKIALAAPPLMADAVRPTLIVDEQTPPPTTSRRAKPSIDCSVDRGRGRMAPLTATDLHAGKSTPGC